MYRAVFTLDRILRSSINCANISTKRLLSMAEQIIDDNKFTGIRLPTNLKPIHYDLSLKPDLKKNTFEGSLRVDFEVIKETKEVVVNSNCLKITDGQLESSDKLTKVIYSPKSETATLEFGGAAINKNGSFTLKFEGILGNTMKGFYRSTVKFPNDEVTLATTQFEATDARRCFPCWDEPSLKATFTVDMTYETKVTLKDGSSMPMIALSNMPQVEAVPLDANLQTVKFAKSPIMSTYLLAFVVGPFDYIECASCGMSKVPIRVYTTPDKKDQGRFALEVACKSLAYYENYFNIPYPLPKMDLIAIPDFLSGAMENWGLITYRETCLLIDPHNSSTASKQRVGLVVAHEIAHQWFGNLVTMEWWTHLWLNEGFASFMEYICLDHIFPEYDIWTQYLNDSFYRSLSLDSLLNSHPIEVEVKDPSEIDEIFDEISYEKGSSVIRMLYNYIGDDSFRKGLSEYLTKFSYKNAETGALWNSLAAASKKPICDIMSGWTTKMGYPYINVEISTSGTSTKLVLTQRRFTANGELPAEQESYTWMVPIDVLVGTSPPTKLSLGLLDSKTKEFVIPDSADKWIKLNAGASSLYRTVYPASMMEKLQPHIANLPVLDRISLVSDYFSLCKAGMIKASDLMQMLESFKNETDYSVWCAIDDSISGLATIFGDSKCIECIDKFHSFVRKLYTNIFNKLTWNMIENEKHTDTLTRPLIINRLVSSADQGVVDTCLNLFKSHSSESKLSPDIRAVVYKTISRYGDDQAFDSLFTLHKTIDLAEEKNRILRALGYTKSQDRVTRVLSYVLSDDVRRQDKFVGVSGVNVMNPQSTWTFFQENGPLFREMFGVSHLMQYMVRVATGNFISIDKANEIETYFKANPFPGTERSVQQIIERIKNNAAWLERDLESAKLFLSKY